MARRGKEAEPKPSVPVPGHDGHCFVVMPYGQDAADQRWFKGWYEAVIQPAVRACNLEPILAAAEDQPGAINDEIRTHLVFDPMVIVDLGGRHPDDPPNPNVMYELGIRHAFGLPLVILAWEGQRLPFDVSNQRAILSQRDFLDMEPTRQRLARFIRAAQEGSYYNPMDAVRREAAIDATTLVLGEDSLLRALADEVRELREVVDARRSQRPRPDRLKKVRNVLGKTKKAELWPKAQSLGLNSNTWSAFLSAPVTKEAEQEMANWDLTRWEIYLADRVPLLKAMDFSGDAPSEEFLEMVKALLPEQPWPTDTHRDVSEKLGVPPKQVTRAIRALIDRGEVAEQQNGVIVDEGNAHPPAGDSA